MTGRGKKADSDDEDDAEEVTAPRKAVRSSDRLLALTPADDHPVWPREQAHVRTLRNRRAHLLSVCRLQNKPICPRLA